MNYFEEFAPIILYFEILFNELHNKIITNLYYHQPQGMLKDL